MVVNRKYFKKLTPEIVEVGDLYFAPFISEIKPAVVYELHDNGFYYRGEDFGGNYKYGESSGVLLKEKDGKLELFVEDILLNSLDNLDVKKFIS